MTFYFRSAAYLLLGAFFSVLLSLFLSANVFSNLAAADDVVLPSDAMVNVTEPVESGGCGLVGDGRVDNTQALRICIKKYATTELWTGGGYLRSPLYFPNGTYLFSDSISWQAFLFLQGQSRDHTVLKLADNAAGFSDSNAPKVFMGLGENQPDFYGVGFRNIMRNFTLDVGAGNPGAIGLSYYGSNQSNAENLLIKTSDAQKKGWAGVAERSGACPGLLKDITVDGFDYGLVPASGCTHEKIALRRQRTAGIYCTQKHYTSYDPERGFSWGGGVGVGGRAIAFLNLTSENSVPAFTFDPAEAVVPSSCGLTLINAKLTGGKPDIAAIDTVGPIYARDVDVQGYRVAIRDRHNQRQTEAAVSEYASETYGLLPNGDLSLKQPFETSPDTAYPSINSVKWASVKDFGANPDDQNSDTQAIQAAIDSGAEVIYLPPSQDMDNQTDYLTDDTIVVRGNVRFVLGLGNRMKSYGGMAGKSIFRIEKTSGEAVVFDALEFVSFDNATDHDIFEHNSSQKLVLKSLLFNNNTATGRIRNAYFSKVKNPGTLFVEDVVGSGHFEIAENGKLYAKQFNLNVDRTLEQPVVSNAGGLVSILQWRAENTGASDTEEPLLRTTKGGSTEILSTWIDNQVQTSPNRAAFEAIDANLFVNARFPGWGIAYKSNPDNPLFGYVNYHIAVRTIQGSDRQNLMLYNTRQLPISETDYSVTAYATRASSPLR